MNMIFLTGAETLIELDRFPTQKQLIDRYYNEINGGHGVTEQEKKL